MATPGPHDHRTTPISPTRRSVLRAAAIGAGAVTLPSVLAACASGGGAGGSGGKTVTFGSNWSDPVPKKGVAKAIDDFQKSQGYTVKTNTVDHNSFQQNINRYLQGNPDDVFGWFAGYRMQYFAQKGLLSDISDIWANFTGFSDAIKAQSTGLDGKQYFVPFYYYPWAVFYRKSVFAQHGYQIPTTWDQYIALAKQMQKDGLVPISFSDKDGWPAMGTFDYINMRLNGYDFHKSLMAGHEDWTDPKVKKVFDTWRELLPYYQQGALGLTWQESAQALQQKKTGMMTLGMFLGQQFGSDVSDLDFFAYPSIDPANGQDAVEAPIDGFLLSHKAKNADASKKLLTFLATAKAENDYLSVDPTLLGVNSAVDTSGYTALQQSGAKLVGTAKSISQFMDRDSRPDFVSTVMIQALQTFLNNPNDIDGLCTSIQRQKTAIYATEG
ncbi:multiple sugar transport system substrate-binding protein [Streptacidiphilus sp. MAP12-33]|uniref:ABC transporter substrate-binding protein n=1 Tax=Streptacidiphilus sp. MAP12-33 TaxID=3156266 RepID=UPI003519C6FE